LTDPGFCRIHAFGKSQDVILSEGEDQDGHHQITFRFTEVHIMKKLLSMVLCILVMLTGILPAECAEDQPVITQAVIGIIGAMDEEVASLKVAVENPEITSIAGMEFCRGKLDGTDVVIVQCGVGKVNAGICAHTLINLFGCTGIINTGVAGSLDAQIDIGDIVVSTDAVQHDFTAEAVGYAKGEIPYTGLYAFPADEAMREAAVKAAQAAAPEVHVFEGRVCSGDQFIASKEQKEKIINDFNGMCCEMEGAAIAQVCYLNDTPFVIIRAISDKADDSEEISYELFMADAAVRCASIVRYMIAHVGDAD